MKYKKKKSPQTFVAESFRYTVAEFSSVFQQAYIIKPSLHWLLFLALIL